MARIGRDVQGQLKGCFSGSRQSKGLHRNLFNWHSEGNTMDSKNIVLNVNGIEVIYNHVILVLKGVSLQVR